MTQAPYDPTTAQASPNPVPSEVNPPEQRPAEVEFYEDFWGVSETSRFTLPDGKQWFEIKPMDEGKKASFQKSTNRGLRMNQQSQEAHIDIDPANERHTLIRQSVVDLLIMQRDPRDGNFYPMPHSTDRDVKSSIETILGKFNPKIIQDLEFFIRMKNPWMQADMDLDQMYEEKDRIEKMIQQHLEQQAGEDSSSSK